MRVGWHPLTAALVDEFQPNDAAIDADARRVAVISGPNGSGKSVYLQQVGLIVFLAHVGCFVPAAAATVGLTDRIATRIVCDEGHDASFAKDLVQLGRLVKGATPRSLLLIDEFGKVWHAACLRASPVTHSASCAHPVASETRRGEGRSAAGRGSVRVWVRGQCGMCVQGTLPTDGAALLLSTLAHFMLRAAPPKVLCVTHCLQVADPALLPRCGLSPPRSRGVAHASSLCSLPMLG